MTLADLINAMGIAGTQDLRGVEVLPYALKIIGTPANPTLATAVAELKAWVASGAHRINREHPGASGSYDQSDAVRIMDAWWPLLVRAEFQPVLGPTLLDQVESDFPINDEPGHGVVRAAHLGSSFDVGFYGIVQKDLRAVLGTKVARPAEPRLLRQAASLARAGPRSRLRWRRPSASPRSRSIRPTACAAPATRCARTRSSSSPSARSRSR